MKGVDLPEAPKVNICKVSNKYFAFRLGIFTVCISKDLLIVFSPENYSLSSVHLLTKQITTIIFP